MPIAESTSFANEKEFRKEPVVCAHVIKFSNNYHLDSQVHQKRHLYL
jgi:translation initiation factor 2B subunit (eIF-2B alpha/beta/delta family)